jgi:hypothetical protein
VTPRPCPRCTYYYGPATCHCNAPEPAACPASAPQAADALATPPRGGNGASWVALGVMLATGACGARDDVTAERLSRLARRCLARVADVPEGVDAVAVIEQLVEQLESEER